MTRAPYPRRLLAARLLFALVLAAHGAAHFIAVVRTVQSLGSDTPLELFGGAVVTSGLAVSMAFAVALATVGVGFIAVAFMLVGREPRLSPLLFAVALLSLAITAVGLWGTVVGVLIDLAVLAVMATAPPRLVDAPQPRVF